MAIGAARCNPEVALASPPAARFTFGPARPWETVTPSPRPAGAPRSFPRGDVQSRAMNPLGSSADRASRALVLDGALAGGAEVCAVAGCVAEEVERLGLHAQRVTLREVQVAPCLGCFECWTRTPGVCRTRDAGRDLARAFVQARLAVFVTPVTFGGYSSELKKAVDRLICVDLPFFTRVGGEVHHPPRYAHRPALLVVGVLPERLAAQERIFQELVRRNAVNLRVPAFASQVLVRPRDAGGGLAPDLRTLIADLLDPPAARARPAGAGEPR